MPEGIRKQLKNDMVTIEENREIVQSYIKRGIAQQRLY